MAVTVPSSVTLCATVSVLPGAPTLNSVTVAETCTIWPAATLGSVLVKTKMPSDVAGLPSPVRSCMKKPLLLTLVTTPVVVMGWPTYGLDAPLPWICQIGALAGAGAGAGGGGGVGVPPAQCAGDVTELRGAGTPVAKSAALL